MSNHSFQIGDNAYLKSSGIIFLVTGFYDNDSLTTEPADFITGICIAMGGSVIHSATVHFSALQKDPSRMS